MPGYRQNFVLGKSGSKASGQNQPGGGIGVISGGFAA